MFTEVLEHAHSAGQSPLLFFETAFHALPVGVTVIDQAGRQIYMNKEAMSILRASQVDHSPAPDWYSEFGCFDPDDPAKQVPFDDLPGVRALLGEAASSYILLRTEGMRHTGEFEHGVLVQVRCTPWFGSSGSVVGVLSVLVEADDRGAAFVPPPGSSKTGFFPAPLPRRNTRPELPEAAEKLTRDSDEQLSPEQELVSLRETVELLRGRRNSANIDALEDGLSAVRNALRRSELQTAK